MEKKVNLLGIRKKVILCHTKSLAGITYTVMRPITEEDEQNLDKFERFGFGIEFTSIQEPPVTPVFRVNKPFVFVIREKSTGVILFIGKMGKIEKY